MTRARTQDRLLILLAAAIAVVSYGLVWTYLKPIVFSAGKSDFACFYRAGRMVIAGDGSRVYDLEAERRYDRLLNTNFVNERDPSFSLPFVFPPYSLALFVPLSNLPYRRAEFAWYVANVGMLLTLPFVLRRTLPGRNSVVAAELLAPVFFLPALLALMQGQPSILLLLLFTIAFAELSEGKEMSAGILLAFASLKPQLVLPMLLALVVWRKWRTLAAFAGTGVALAGVSAAIVGWQATLHYPRAVANFNQLAGAVGGEHPQSMPNLRGCIYVLLQGRLSEVALPRVTAALSILLLIILATLLKRFSAMSSTTYSLVIVITLLVSYHAYLHDDSLLLLPIILMARHARCYRRTVTRTALVAVIVVLYVVPLLPTSLSATAMQMFAAMAILAAVLAMEMRSEGSSALTVRARQEFCDAPAFGGR